VHLFVDLTTGPEPARADSGTRGWPLEGRLTVRAARTTCVVRPGSRSLPATVSADEGWQIVSTESPISACSQAMARAAADRACFLLLSGPVEISDETLLVLRQALDADPLFGAVVARIGCTRGCCFKSMSPDGVGAGRWLPRRALADIPPVDIGLECMDGALLVAPQVVGEFGDLPDRFSTLRAAVPAYLSTARRCGYRTVVANRAVVTIAGAGCDRPLPDRAIPDGDLALLEQIVPERERAWREFRAGAAAGFEELIARGHEVASGRRRPSLLVDIRNVGAVHNGTTQGALGNLRALRQLSPPWEVAVLSNPAAIEFHGLVELCRDWDLCTAPPARMFTVALRLTQPWHTQEIIDLHRAALFTAFYMLDTISWDVVYAAPAHLDGTWSFLADVADGFLFNSAFTERRFVTRFPAAGHAARAVCHHPFAASEYVRARQRPTNGTSILVVGNDLDHKDVLRTVEVLADAFPFQPIVCFGPPSAARPGVRVCRSGRLSDDEVHQMYADASLVVLPSFYEGFGFPIVTGLAYGKTVVARRSDLLTEIAEHCTSGRLVAFTHRDELVEIIGRILHGEDVRQEPLGAEVTGAPRVWRDAAHDLMRFLDALVREPARSRWRHRERVVNQMLAARV
jgi:glycosyltransferase involved in cell wall biosynthesis